jgi:hypothetical protein
LFEVPFVSEIALVVPNLNQDLTLGDDAEG